MTDTQDSVPSNDTHLRPSGVDDITVAAAGKVSEALETIERARGHLYTLHQLVGHADLMLDEAVELLKKSGNAEEADKLSKEIIGRNVLPGRWTFQIIEEFDDGYYADFKAYEKHVRDTFMQGRRHVYESEMKEQRRTRGQPGHEARPEVLGNQ